MSNEYPLEKYKQDFANADWHYEYAEGYQHQQGREEMHRLCRLAKISPEHEAAFDRASKAHRSR